MKKVRHLLTAREDGLNGIAYALYVSAILIIVGVFVLLQFHIELYLLKQNSEDSLHIVGSAGLTFSATGVTKANTEKLYIIANSKGSTSSTWKPGEEAEVKAFGEYILMKYKTQMEITGDTTPTGPIAVRVCGDGSKVELSKLILYQPLYKVTVTEQLNQNPPFHTVIDYSAVVKYTFSIHDNKLSAVPVTKEYISGAAVNSLRLHSGNKIEGTTIEMCTSASFNGVHNIYASTVDAGESAVRDNTGRIIATFRNYNVQVWSAVDIVPAMTDSRDKENNGK